MCEKDPITFLFKTRLNLSALWPPWLHSRYDRPDYVELRESGAQRPRFNYVILVLDIIPHGNILFIYPQGPRCLLIWVVLKRTKLNYIKSNTNAAPAPNPPCLMSPVLSPLNLLLPARPHQLEVLH